MLNLATLSDGTIYDNEQYLKKLEHKLRKTQRDLSRKQGSKKNEPKSNRYKRQQRKLRKLHNLVANARRDYIEKATTEICKTYKNIALENLDVQEMESNKKYSKSIKDASFGLFKSCIERKANKFNNNVFMIDKYYPSTQICSNCGSRTKIDISERIYNCKVCDCSVNRDINAALNLEHIARLILSRGSREDNARGENVRLVSLNDIEQISEKRVSGMIKSIRPESHAAIHEL